MKQKVIKIILIFTIFFTLCIFNSVKAFEGIPSEYSMRVWPITNVDVTDASGNSLGTIEATYGQAFAAKKEPVNGKFAIYFNEQEGYIDANVCLVNLPDYLTGVGNVSYNITNGSGNIYKINGQSIPGITGNKYYKSSSLVPLLYPVAQKFKTAALAAAAKGYGLKIYDAYRPSEVTQKTYTTLNSYLSSNPAVKNDMLNDPNGKKWSVSYFLSRGVSKHNLGVALDLTLTQGGQELTMQSAIHELSWRATLDHNNDNANTLSSIMTSVGFETLVSEWWHFQVASAGSTAGSFQVCDIDDNCGTANNGSMAEGDAASGVCKNLKIDMRRPNNRLLSSSYDPTNYNWGGYKHPAGNYLIAYTAKAACEDDQETEYDAFCIDPARDNPNNIDYTIESELALDTIFGRAIYYLYTDYYIKNKTDEGLFISTQVARFLVKNYSTDSGGFLTGNHSSNLNAYLNGSITPAKAAEIYNQVVEKATSTNKDYIESLSAKLSIEKGEGDEIKDGIKFIITASNIEDTSNISNLKVVIKNAAGQDISEMFTVEGLNNWENSNGAKTNTITIKSNDNFDENICEIKVEVSGEYSDDYSISNVFIVHATNANDANNYQRFLIFNKQGKVRLGAEAESPTSETCGEEAKCFTFQSFLCLPTSNTNYIVEGVNLNTMAVDWDNCVIDKQDPAGNDYNVVENDYCKIACKEDFAFRLPGGLGNFSQGRYIPVNLDGYMHTVAGVATQKSCVTSEILVDQYIEDATNLKKEMLNYLNMFYYYVGAAKYLIENRDEYVNNVQVKSAYATPALDVSSWDFFPSEFRGLISTVESLAAEAICLTELPSKPDYVHDFLERYDYKFDYDYYVFEEPEDGEELDIVKAKVIKAEDTKSGQSGNKPEDIDFTDIKYESATIPSNELTIPNMPPLTEGTWGPLVVLITQGAAAGGKCFMIYTWHGSIVEPNDAVKNLQWLVGIGRILKKAYEVAQKYNETRETLVEKTGYIKDCTRWNSGKNYEYQVELDFDYDEQEYIKMILNDTQLEIDNEPEYPFSYNLYCNEMTEVDNMYTKCKPGINAPSTGNSLLDGLVSSIISGVESSVFGIEKKDVQVPNDINILSAGLSVLDFSNLNLGSLNLGILNDYSYVSLNLDDFYFYIRRLASVAMYGYPGVGLTGGVNLETVFSLFLQEAIRIFSNKAFIYYKPKYSFFTTPDKGIVSLTPMTEDSELIDTDGLVYPIKLTTKPGDYLYKLSFEKVGQYFPNETQYGRVLGSSGYVSILPTIEISTGIGILDNLINSAIGSIIGYEKNDYLCDYSVCAVDDPNCEDDPTTPDTGETDGGKEDGGNTPNEGANCQSIYSSQICSNDATLDDCITQLLNDNCCSYVDALGKMVISQNTIDQYNAVCGKNFCCSGTGIIDGSFSSSVGGSPSGGIGSGNNYVNNASTIDNKLEFFSKVVSLNNLFPNDDESRGFNWIGATSDGLEIDTVISEIEEKGESIYSEEPEYSLILDPTCAARIREYNAQQEASDLGFNDFTLKKYDSVFLNELESYGCVVVNDNTDNDKSD